MYTILNLNRTEDHEDIYTISTVSNVSLEQKKERLNNSQNINNLDYYIFRFFDKKVKFSKDYVDAFTYSNLSETDKANYVTLDFDTYIIADEVNVTKSEYTLSDFFSSYKLYKVYRISENKRGSIETKHIEVEAK